MHRDSRIYEPRPLRRNAEPPRRREPAPALRAAARARALRDRFGARDGHRAVAGIDASRPAARGGASCATARRGTQSFYALAIDGAARHGQRRARRSGAAPTDPTLDGDQTAPARARCRAPRRLAGVASRTSSSATIRRGARGSRSRSGIAALLDLGDVLDVGSGDGAAAASLAPYCRSLTCIDTSARMIDAAQGAPREVRARARAGGRRARAAVRGGFVRFRAGVPHADVCASSRARARRNARACCGPADGSCVLCLDEHEQQDVTAPLRRASPRLLAAHAARAAGATPASTSSSPRSRAAKPRNRTSKSCWPSPRSAPPRAEASHDDRMPAPTSPAPEAPPAAHRHHRRRDGHHHPHLRHDRSRHPRRALQGLEEGPAEQRRPVLAHAARDDLRHPPALPRGRRGHHRDQHVRRDQHRAERVLRRRPARARRPQGPGVLPEDHRGPVPQRPGVGDQRAVRAPVPRVGRPRRQPRRQAALRRRRHRAAHRLALELAGRRRRRASAWSPSIR